MNSNCKKCGTNLSGYKWEQTKNGKWWFKNSDGIWHDCPKPNTIATLTSKDYKPDTIRKTLDETEEIIDLISSLRYKGIPQTVKIEVKQIKTFQE